MQAVKCPDIYASIRLPVESFHQVHNIEKGEISTEVLENTIS